MKQKLLNIYFHIFAFFAKKYLKKHKPLVLGVTGSIGKTGARMIISQILEKHLTDKVLYTSSKNYNGELGLSLSILKIKDYTPTFTGIFKTLYNAFIISFFSKKMYDIVFLEYGIDHVGEMDFLLSIVKPDISLITKVDKVHSKQFKNKDTIAREKYKLAINTKDISFLNYDCEYSQKYFGDIKAKKYFYSSNHLDTDKSINIKGLNYEIIKNNNKLLSKFDLEIDSLTKAQITSNLLGVENIGYICVGVFLADKLNNNSLLKQNEKLEYDFLLQSSRFGIFDGIKSSILIDSTYNASPLSMKKAIENVVNLRDNYFQNYKLIFALGDMRELGNYEQKEHENLADFLAGKYDKIYLVGKVMKDIFIPKIKDDKNVFYFQDSTKLGNNLKDFVISSNDKYLILFKGSQNTIFLEEAIKKVLLNEGDKSKLCRQDDFWLSKKKIL